VGEGDVDPISLDAQADGIAVEAQLGRRVGDFDAVELGLGQHVFAGSGRAVEEKLPERSRRYGDQGHDPLPAPGSGPWSMASGAPGRRPPSHPRQPSTVRFFPHAHAAEDFGSAWKEEICCVLKVSSR
jgi:hypothetical protein